MNHSAMKEGRKREYPEKTLDDKLQKKGIAHEETETRKPLAPTGRYDYSTLTLSGLTILRALSFVTCAALKEPQDSWFAVTPSFKTPETIQS